MGATWPTVNVTIKAPNVIAPQQNYHTSLQHLSLIHIFSVAIFSGIPCAKIARNQASPVALARLFGAPGSVPFSGPVSLRFFRPLENFIFYTLRSFHHGSMVSTHICLLYTSFCVFVCQGVDQHNGCLLYTSRCV